MQEPEIGQDTIREQLKTKRNRLLQEFLGNPTQVRLTTEIRLIDDRLAELNWHSEERSKLGAV
jgi:hypothetical protein